jgi:hypothetical protein
MIREGKAEPLGVYAAFKAKGEERFPNDLMGQSPQRLSGIV